MIGICGLGYSGSGALTDLLKEFDSVKVYDEIEFDFVYAPDGIEDLYYHLCENPVRYLSGNTAIKRFINLKNNFSRNSSAYMKATKGKFADITDQYIESLIQVRWNGSDIYEKIASGKIRKTIKYRVGGRIDDITQRKCENKGSRFSYSDMYLSVRPENFIEISKQYLKNIMNAMGVDQKSKVVLNQPFPSNNPERYYKYYDAPMSIIVDKDPRDQYILAKKILRRNGSFIPTENVEDFIVYYQKMHEEQSKAIRLNFEDLIYEYNKTIKSLKTQLGLGMHKNPKRYFDPSISINNTQLFKRYPEYKNDVKTIEKELESYLFSFEKYGEIKFTSESF